MYSDAFLAAMDWTVLREGEWGAVPFDRGGRTRWGISERTFPDVDLDTLTWGGAMALYHEHFWTPLAGDAMPYPLALALLDWAVLSGVPRVAESLQSLLGVRIDGRIGPKTLAAVRRSSERRLLELLLQRRVAFHLADWRRSPEQPIQGWLNRTILVALEAAVSAIA